MKFYDYRKWAWEQDIKPSTRKFVLVCISEFSDEKGSCYPKIETIAEMVGQGVSTVRDHIKHLADDGFLKRDRLRHKDGTLAQYRYFLQCQNSALGQPSSASSAPSPAPALPPHQRQLPADNNNQLTDIEDTIDPQEGVSDPIITNYDDPALEKDVRIPFLDKFVPTAEFKSWARIDLRLKPDEVRDIMVSCVEYWRGQSNTKKGKKTPRGWNAAIRNWFRGEATRLKTQYREAVLDTRKQKDKLAPDIEISDEVWDYDVRIFRDEDNWRGMGPAPGELGCKAPEAILQKYGFTVASESG